MAEKLDIPKSEVNSGVIGAERLAELGVSRTGLLGGMGPSDVIKVDPETRKSDGDTAAVTDAVMGLTGIGDTEDGIKYKEARAYEARVREAQLAAGKSNEEADAIASKAFELRYDR